MRALLVVLLGGCQFLPDAVPEPVADEADAGEPPGPGAADASAPVTTDGPAGPTPDAAPSVPMTSLPRRMWNGRLWAYSANTAGYPQFDDDEVTLTANNSNRSGVLFLIEDRAPPFTVELEYLTWDNDGCTVEQSFNCVYRTADGWSFMFGKDIVPYEEAPPPAGQSRGFVPDGTGQAVHFRLYEVRGVGLRDGALNLLTGIGEETYSESYREVRIVVDPQRLRVYLDGSSSPRIDYVPDAPWDTSFRWIGIGAGTGGAAAMHRIRRVMVTP